MTWKGCLLVSGTEPTTIRTSSLPEQKSAGNFIVKGRAGSYIEVSERSERLLVGSGR